MCPRSDTPLIYRSIPSWYVSVEKIKENLIASNNQINWVPDHIKTGRFGKWLEGARTGPSQETEFGELQSLFG